MKSKLRIFFRQYLMRRKTMKIHEARDDQRLLAALYIICTAFGVLPIWRHHNRTKPTRTNHSDCFKPNRKLMVVTWLQVIFAIFSAYYLHPFRRNAETLEYILWYTHFTSTLATLLLCSQSATKLSVTLSDACKIHSQSRKRFKTVSLISFSVMIFLTFLPIFAIIFTQLISQPKDFKVVYYFIYNYSYIPLALMEVLISCLCRVAEQAHVDTNIRIRGIKKKASVKTFFLLRDLIERHLHVQEFIRDFAQDFRLHFLNIFLTMKIRLTFYAIYQVEQISVNNYSGIIVFIYHTVMVTSRVFSLCFRCHRVQEEADETATIIRRIQVNWMEDLSDDQSELLDYYQQLISASKVTFTASGLFDVSIPQLMTVIGLIITYSLVALQSTSIKSQ